MEDELEEKTGRKIKIPVDKEGADVLLLHNAGEFMAWPENIEAFALIFDAAGIDWTISSSLLGYDGVNYGVWYDDVQFARIALRHAEVARDLHVKKISVGECGHSHKAMMVIADRVLTGDLNIPRESSLPLLEDLVCNGKLKLDPTKNDFPRYPPRPLQHGETHGHRRATAANPQEDMSSVQGDGAPRG